MENIILYAIPFILFFVLVSIQLISTKPNGRVIKKYGKPIKYFSNKKCFNTVPMRGTSVGMYIYSDFIILLDGGKEYFLDKEFKNFKLYGSILIKIFEIETGVITVMLSHSLSYNNKITFYYIIIDM